MILFPELRGRAFGYVNLDLEARRWAVKNKTFFTGDKNPLLDSDICAGMVDGVHEAKSLSASYGGWLEDRSFLWRGSYLDRGNKFLHLGVDFNVPAGTLVAAPFEAEVAHFDSDFPEDGGWGRRVVLFSRLLMKYFIFAHLDDSISCRKGQFLGPGDVFASVGSAPTNGNWFPHLHVQAVSQGRPSLSLIKSFRLDGYAPLKEAEKWSWRCPDPLQYFLFR